MARTTANTVTFKPSEPETDEIDVTHLTGDAFAVEVRGHRLLVDQPTEAGGGDAAPTPTELFVASLATCIAFYAGRYLARHGIDQAGLRVHTEFTMATDRPFRVAEIRVRISSPPELPERRRAALLAVASRCTVHNTLHHEPEIDVALEF